MECAVCGGPFSLKFRRGLYIWQGTTRAHLCPCYEQERKLAEEDRIASGLQQGQYPQFLDFVSMWLSGYSRSTVWREMVQQGVDPGRRQVGLFRVLQDSQFLPNTLSKMAAPTLSLFPYAFRVARETAASMYPPELAPCEYRDYLFPRPAFGIFRGCRVSGGGGWRGAVHLTSFRWH